MLTYEGRLILWNKVIHNIVPFFQTTESYNWQNNCNVHMKYIPVVQLNCYDKQSNAMTGKTRCNVNFKFPCENYISHENIFYSFNQNIS